MRIAYDTRMKEPVQELLSLNHKLETYEDPVALFLENVVDLAAIADILAEKGHNFLLKELQAFARATEHYAKSLERHKYFVDLYLNAPKDPYSTDLHGYTELRKALETIATNANAGVGPGGLRKYIEPARKGQQHTYFVRMIDRAAREIFGKVLSAKSMGALVEVCFEIEYFPGTSISTLRKRSLIKK